jgi:hypothetical protein
LAYCHYIFASYIGILDIETDAWVALVQPKISENFHLNVQICLIDLVQIVSCNHGALGSAIYYS